MSREITFRGKNIQDGQWVYGDLNIDTDKRHAFIIDYSNSETDTYSWCEVCLETVGQYTCLNDINGNKIYEGDFVEYDDKKYKVVYESFGFMLVNDEIKQSEFFHMLDYSNLKVIGNIYE